MTLENPFKSFLKGGFECSSHRNRNGRRLDMIAATRHDEFAEADYNRLMEKGIMTARDGLRWHLIEVEPYRYDFSSLQEQVRAARSTGIQIIWDYFHYGYPDDIDLFSNEFVERFTVFSQTAAEFLTAELGDDLIFCPVNEISFFSWVAGQAGAFFPYARRRGDAVKRQLVKSAISSINVVRNICPHVRWILTEPAINVIPRNDSRSAKVAAEKYRVSQFHALDAISGRSEPELGGDPTCLDIIGLNYYIHNQWLHPSRRPISRQDPRYQPFNKIISEFYQRYERPLVVSETGIEDGVRPEWFRYVYDETETARINGIPLQGLCLYPVVNHPGWEDNRHCHNGLWDYSDDDGHREIYEPLADEIHRVNGHQSRAAHPISAAS